MRIFVSYARVDAPYCVRIVNTLNAHDVWYDARLYAGTGWWNEILRRLDWCEGFVYLLSPDSLASEYCRREYQLAKSLGRHIIPIVIQPDTVVPNGLSEIHHINMSNGLTAENVKELLDSIYVAENRRFGAIGQGDNGITSESVRPPTLDLSRVLEDVTEAMGQGNYDRAVFLLEQAKAKGFESKYINLDQLLIVAKDALARETYLRQADREYRQIAALVRHRSTQNLGCEAFRAFRRDFPDFDPDKIVSICSNDSSKSDQQQPVVTIAPVQEETLLATIPTLDPSPAPAPSPLIGSKPVIPMLDFCDIPEGYVQVDNPETGQGSGKPVHVPAFQMAVYPITIAQYQVFLDDPEGYANSQWWRFSRAVYEWRSNNPNPHPAAFKGDERPREMVNWYDALAFCNWLSSKMNGKITLPTVEQRQRAIQGSDERVFPWGNTFDKNRCNTRESEIRMTTNVTRYPDGVNEYGVFDLAGNVWEWCLNLQNETREDETGARMEMRAVHGGSFVSPCQRAEATFRYYLNPQIRYASIGFRVVQNA